MSKQNRKARPQKTKAELDHELQLAAHRWPVIGRIGINLIWAVAAVLVTYFGVAVPVQASAGQTTRINYVLSWVQSWNIGTQIAFGGAAATTIWALRERRMRMKERSQKDDRIKELEERIDPKRTSSGLNVSGDKEA